MSIDDLRDLLSVAAALIATGGAIYAWLTARSKANSGALRELEREHREVEHRVTSVEGDIRHLPDKESVHALQLAISEMRGSMGRIEESLGGTNRTVRRMEEFLMETRK
jgi:hypothetical protein